jgi:propanediol dehydratase small subunit
MIAVMAPQMARPSASRRECPDHQQAAEVGVAEAERAEVVAQLGDLLAGELRHQHRDLEHDVHSRQACVARDVEAAVLARNFIRLSDARLQAVSSRNMYSEHGLLALIGRRPGRCASR